MHTTLSCLLMSFHYICVRPMSERANNGFERFSFKMHVNVNEKVNQALMKK